MEKQRINRTSGFIKRLLILLSAFVLFTFNLFSYNLEKNSLDELDALSFKVTEKQNLFTNIDIQFEVIIPNVKSAEIQVLQDNNGSKTNVSFKSMKKFENFTDEGTIIQICYNFDTEGKYELLPLKVSVQGKNIEIPFQPIVIKEDPAKMMPRIVIIFSNGVKIKSDDIFTSKPIFDAFVEQKLNFTVYLQHVNQLVHLTFDIPKNSIYKQIKTYEITEDEYKESINSQELIPVADFEWTGLLEGKHPIPKFKLTAIDYNGYRIELMLPEFEVNFIAKKQYDNSNLEENLFVDAFEENIEENEKPVVTKVSISDCEKLAKLHKQERNSIFSKAKYKKTRIALEEELGLPISKSPYNKGILILCIALIIIFLIFLIISIRKKYVFRVFILSILLFSATVLLIFSIQKRSQLYGLSKGTKVYSIPEATAETHSDIAPGYIVSITEKTDNWYYIHLGETSGWCSKDNIIVIR